MGKDVKVNVSGVAMSVETGDVTIIDNLLEALRKELISVAGDNPTELKKSIEFLVQRGLIIKSVIPEDWDGKILEWWLDLADKHPETKGSKLCNMLSETDEFLFFWNGTVLPTKKDKHSDKAKFIMNSIVRSRGSVKI